MANVTTGSNSDQFEYRVIYTSGGVLQDNDSETGDDCWRGADDALLNDTTQRTRTFYPAADKEIDENSSFTVLIKDKGTGAITTSGTINIPTATTLAGGSSGASAASTNPYKAAVLAAQQLYTVGESALTKTSDIVKINGVECYVLQVSADGTKAELITKNIYDSRFNSLGKGYDYSTSELKTFMDNFYTNELGEDEHILDTEVTVYTSESYDLESYSNDLTPFITSTLTQKVFALDGKEAINNFSKFSWSTNSYDYGFWTTAGCSGGGSAYAFNVYYYGSDS